MSARTGTVLDRILSETRAEVQRRKRELPLQAPVVDEAAGGGTHRFREAIAQPGIAVIAEFKRRSPSAGALREAPDLAEIVSAYTRGGAAALSILTEGPNFAGSLADLTEARAALGVATTTEAANAVIEAIRAWR